MRSLETEIQQRELKLEIEKTLVEARRIHTETERAVKQINNAYQKFLIDTGRRV